MKALYFYDAAKAFEQCEICLGYLQEKRLAISSYEFFFNSFILSINQAWELMRQEFNSKRFDKGHQLSIFMKNIEVSRDFRSIDSDPLLTFIKEARNQLAHRESLLWISNQEVDCVGLGAKINMGQEHFTVPYNRYSRVVLPSLSSTFCDVLIALKPVTTKDGTKVNVPSSCKGVNIKTDPFSVLYASYLYYGEQFEQLLYYIRKV